MWEKGVPISVTAVMSEYDRKADSYGRENPNLDNSKKELKFSTFSNNDELNCNIKRTSITPKVGDQRTIVDYINFYQVGDSCEIKQEVPVFVKKK